MAGSLCPTSEKMRVIHARALWQNELTLNDFFRSTPPLKMDPSSNRINGAQSIRPPHLNSSRLLPMKFQSSEAPTLSDKQGTQVPPQPESSATWLPENANDRSELAKAAAQWLNMWPQNWNRKIEGGYVERMFERNPSYVKFCEELDCRASIWIGQNLRGH